MTPLALAVKAATGARVDVQLKDDALVVTGTHEAALVALVWLEVELFAEVVASAAWGDLTRYRLRLNSTERGDPVIRLTVSDSSASITSEQTNTAPEPRP